MSAEFDGKVVLVTGGASGIGRATVLAFVRQGASVVVLDRDAAAAERLLAELKDSYSSVVLVHGDVRSSEDNATAVRTCVESFGGLDVLVCCAGVFEPGTVETQTEEAWDVQLDVLLKGPFLACKHAVPAMRARSGGAIVFIASSCAHVGCPNRVAYTAAKAALPVLAKQIAGDYFHSAGIRVNCVSPGYVRTPMTERIWRAQSGAAIDATPPKGWQSPEAIASVILFLASAAAADVAGATLPVSGTGLFRVAAQRLA